MKDRIQKGEITVEYCPTHQMLADYFTKSLQGKSFYAFRDVLMGWKHINSLYELTSSSTKERVENNHSSQTKNKNISNFVAQENVSNSTSTHTLFSTPTMSSKIRSNPASTYVSWADVVNGQK